MGEIEEKVKEIEKGIYLVNRFQEELRNLSGGENYEEIAPVARIGELRQDKDILKPLALYFETRDLGVSKMRAAKAIRQAYRELYMLKWPYTDKEIDGAFNRKYITKRGNELSPVVVYYFLRLEGKVERDAFGAIQDKGKS